MRKLGISSIILLLSLLILALSVSLMGQVLASAPDDWPMFRLDSQHTGSTAATVPSNSSLWQFTMLNHTLSSCAAVDGVVYAASGNGFVYALNAASGLVLWQYYVGGVLDSSPATISGVVYIGVLYNVQNGTVYALNAANGALLWKYATPSGIESSPTVVNGVVYIGSGVTYAGPSVSNPGNIYALNATSGALIWYYPTGGPIFSSPAISGNILYIDSNDSYVYALNAANGALA
jgi:outer membrane protein assembly factor BamB